MFEFVDTHPDCNVSEAEYVRLLGYPKDRPLADRARELADAAAEWFSKNGRPWIYARETETIRLSEDHFMINDTAFSSRRLVEQFTVARVNTAILVAVSAGPECEEHAGQLWQDGRPDEYFFLEIFGSAVVEHLVTLANGRICAWADANGKVALPHHSPGYSGWNMSAQLQLWNVLRAAGNNALPGALTVLESGMLRPKKSLIGLIGIASDTTTASGMARLVPCMTCALPGCQFRRAPFIRSRRPALS